MISRLRYLDSHARELPARGLQPLRTLVANPPDVRRGRALGSATRRGRSPKIVLAFVASSAIMALTGSMLLLAVWLGIWCLAASKTSVVALLELYIAVTLFYPTYPPGAGSLQEYSVVKAALLSLVLMSCHRDLGRMIRFSKWFRLVLFGWVVWGTLGYVPVLVTWAVRVLFDVRGWDALGISSAETSMSKSALPVILAVVAAVLPVAALKSPEDFSRFANWLFGAAMLLILLSTAQWVLGIPLIAMPYESDPARMTGFSMPDPNGYARLLLMPTVLGISFAVRGSVTHGGSKPWLIWLIATSGVCNILLTQSRTAYAALAMGFLVLVALNLRRTRPVAAALAILVVAGVAFSGLGLVGVFAPGEERRSAANVVGRAAIAEKLLQIIRDKPLFGTHPGEGYFNAMSDLGARPDDGADHADEVRGQTPHNQLLGLAAVWGIPMAVFFLLTWVATAVYGFRAFRIARRLPSAPGISDLAAVAQATVALAVAFFVEGLGTHLHDDTVFWIFGMSLAVWCCLADPRMHLRDVQLQAAGRLTYTDDRPRTRQ